MRFRALLLLLQLLVIFSECLLSLGFSVSVSGMALGEILSQIFCSIISSLS